MCNHLVLYIHSFGIREIISVPLVISQKNSICDMMLVILLEFFANRFFYTTVWLINIWLFFHNFCLIILRHTYRFIKFKRLGHMCSSIKNKESFLKTTQYDIVLNWMVAKIYSFNNDTTRLRTFEIAHYLWIP